MAGNSQGRPSVRADVHPFCPCCWPALRIHYFPIASNSKSTMMTMTMITTTTQCRRHHHGPATPIPSLFVMVACVVSLLASIVTAAASSAAAAANVNVDAQPNPNSIADHHHHEAVVRRRWLQFTTTPDLSTLFTNGTDCPKDCPLCECGGNSTSTSTDNGNNDDAESCIYTKSITACSSGLLPACYANLLPFFDLTGLCSSQCTTDTASRSTATTSQQDEMTATLCRICDIFACCDTCPKESVEQCFPPMTAASSGYTPVGWEPLSCENGVVAGGGNGSNGGSGLKGKRNGVIGMVVTSWLVWQM